MTMTKLKYDLVNTIKPELFATVNNYFNVSIKTFILTKNLLKQIKTNYKFNKKTFLSI